MSSKLSANALKRGASVIATYNEISLCTDTDKGTQMGGAHISSRARPDFCIFCTERHSPISCPKVNPVCQDTIEAIVNNPENKDVPVSKCRDYQSPLTVEMVGFFDTQLLESGNSCLTQEPVA